MMRMRSTKLLAMSLELTDLLDPLIDHDDLFADESSRATCRSMALLMA